MKLTQLVLPSFRSYQSISLDLDARLINIAGLNGSGKTGIKNAIRWVLTGRCEGTDARGAGAEVLIPTGEKAAKVGAVVSVNGQILKAVREFTAAGGSFAVQEFTGTSAIQQAALYAKLATTPEFMDAALDTDAFLRLNHVEGKALVLSLLGVKIEVGHEAYTLDQLDAKYREAFEERKQAKRLLASRQALPAKPAEQQMPSEAAITAQLEKLRGERGKLQLATGDVRGQRRVLFDDDVRLQTASMQPVGEDLTSAIETLEARITSLETHVAPPEPSKTDPSRIVFLRDRLEAVRTHLPKAGCVLDREVPCKTPGGQFEARQKALEEELKQLAPPAVEPSESPLTAARRELKRLQDQQQTFEAELRRAGEASARRQAIRQELDALPSLDEQDAAISALDARILKGEELLRAARAYWAVAEQYKRAVDDLEIAQAEVSRLEALVETLGPKGVRVKALGDAMARFEAAVNPYVERFGWRISFSIDPWDVLANGRSVETYSRSERFRIGIALQLGIAQLSGLNFAVIDEVDMLDAANRAEVSKMLMSAPLEQILILGTRETAQPLKPMQGVIAYRLASDQGKTTIVERVAA